MTSKANPDAPTEPVVHSRTRRYLQSLSPVQREDVARWLEALTSSYPDQVARLTAFLGAGGSSPSAKGQILHLRAALAFSRHAAYLVRTARYRKREEG